MILDLDQNESLDPDRVGSKASRLAVARRAGLPILPGFVVTAEASRHHLELGARQLETRGSGGARLAVIGEPVPFGSDLISAGSALGPILVARSSTALERSGEWSGGFTSYLDLTPADLPKAVAGCWASAFSVAALERQKSAGIQPGSFLMSVLVQPALQPQSGGAAELDSNGAVVVHGVEGPPGPLLQGWVGGHRAHRSRGENGDWVGSDLIEIVGTGSLDTLAASLRSAQETLGINRCEWALDGDLWILQLDVTSLPTVRPGGTKTTELTDPVLVRVAQTAMRAPGKLAEQLVMPWALAGLPAASPSIIEYPDSALSEAKRLSVELTSQVWGMPPEEAVTAAQRCISELLGPNPSKTLERLHNLRPPDSKTAATLMSLLDLVRADRRPDAIRLGVGRWEPFVASVVLDSGESYQGTPASSGIGAGIRSNIVEPQTTDRFVERTVITSNKPSPGLASLLWDAAAIVTETGSPVAHLFESARSLVVPAVCGVSIPADSDQIVAVDGYSGVVATIPLYDDVRTTLGSSREP